MALTPARRAAGEVLAAVARGRRLDLALDAAVAGLDLRRRRFVHELTYGTIRLRGRLDHLLAQRVDRGFSSLRPAVLDVLRLGAYQVLYMDGVPTYAAVSQAVSHVRAVGESRAAGLVNAVLRNVAKAGDTVALFPGFESDPAAFLSTWGSHPRWLVERWLGRWPPGEVRALVEADNQVPPLTLVPLADDTPAAVRAIRAVGGAAEPLGRGSPALRVEGLSPTEALVAVSGIIQDPGAALVARFAAAFHAERVADLCAAPGGKALYLARSAAYVVAVDPSSARLTLLEENVRRTGSKVGVVRGRAEQPPLARADLVLVDAPCSGTGTLRRHPDARWRLGPGDPLRLKKVQARLLHGASAIVPPGGVLVYSTCTLEPEENQEVVDEFRIAHPDFRPVAPEGLDLPDMDDDGRLLVLPQRTGFDGAFAAAFRRE